MRPLRCGLTGPHRDNRSERCGQVQPRSFTIKLDMVLDQPGEQDLVRMHVQAVYLTSRHGRSQQAANSLEETVDWLVAGSLTPLMAGTLVIRYRAAAARPWAAYWEFSDLDSGATWHAVPTGCCGPSRRMPPSWTSRPPGGSRRSSRSSSLWLPLQRGFEGAAEVGDGAGEDPVGRVRSSKY